MDERNSKDLDLDEAARSEMTSGDRFIVKFENDKLYCSMY